MRTKVLAAVLCLSVVGHSASVHANAAIRRTTNIPAQALGAALNRLAKDRDLQVVYRSEVVGTLTTEGAVGQLTADEAFKLLLSGTGLTYRFIDEKTVTIVPAAVSPKAASSVSFDMNTASPQADESIGATSRLVQADAGQKTENLASNATVDPEVNEVIVRGVQFRYEKEVRSANKMPMSVKDTPQSVKVVTQDLIEFSGIRQFEDVYKIDASGGTSHAIDDHARNYYRGFLQQSDNAIKVDGFRMTGEVNLDLAPFERFEIVKGATSTLYGQNSIAGTLNAITKQPKSDFGGELRTEIGSFDHYRADVDLYGPLAADGRLAYRMVGAYTQGDSFLDVAGKDIALFAPALRYDFSTDTTLTARVIYQEDDARHHFGHGLLITQDGLRIPDVRRSRFAGMDWNSVTRDALFVQTTLDHQLSSGWQVRGSLQYNEVEGRLTEFIPVGLDEDGTALLDANYARNDDDEAYAAEVAMFGDVEVLGRNHTLFVGVDHSLHDFDHVTATDFVGAAFNIFDPDPRLYAARPNITDYPEFYGQRDRKRESGLTVQALLRPLDPFTLSLGARYTRNLMTSRSRSGDMALLGDLAASPFGPADEIKSEEVTLQAGLTYAITPDVNLYASYGETFEPQFGQIAGGGLIAPERGNARELGLKGDLAGKLSYSLALFHMVRENISQADILTPGFVVPLGTQRSQGIEIDFQGEIVRGWNVYGSVAWLDAEFTEGQFEGLQPANAPRFGASLFTSYEFRSSALRGLGIGGGIVHKSGRETFDEDGFGIFGSTQVFDFGDFTEVDMRIFYSTDHWRLQLAGTNLTDEKYYSPTFNNFLYALHVNPARALTASVAYRF